MTFRIRYTRGTREADAMPTLTYPLYTQPGFETREHAEKALLAMPRPGVMEIIEGDDD